MPDIFGEQSSHIPVLLQAWAYILSARWAELIPYAHISLREQVNKELNRSPLLRDDQGVATIDIGPVSEVAARWWTTILSVEGGWAATIRNKEGDLLHSPWSTTLTSKRPLRILTKTKMPTPTSNNTPSTSTSTSSSAACRYLIDYCINHDIDDDTNLAALAAALLIPTAQYEARSIGLPIPEVACDEQRAEEKSPSASSFTILNELQLDRLLTLSCNARATKVVLTSVSFERDVESNTCGMWLQGSFAFLITIKDPHSLLRTLIHRDPEIGFLWIGAFITGASVKALREGRAGWWKIDLGAAAWTGTLMSFVQAPVRRPPPGTTSISRADECRLLYLCHGMDYTSPPLFPFPPFGSTALDDTNLDVHERSPCGKDHSLSYVGMTWRCKDGKGVKQGPEGPIVATRPKTGPDSNHSPEIDVDFDDYDSDDENSEMVTRNIFTWLRGQDGFHVAERAIREHELIDNLDSDDDEPIERDVRSTVGGRLHGWLLKTSTQRSNSI